MITSEQEMDADERVSVIAIHLALNELLFTHAKILSRAMHSWEPAPEDLLTPRLVRAIVRKHLDGLGRARLVEAYVLGRLKINGADFFAWEKDPSVVLRTTPELLESHRGKTKH